MDIRLAVVASHPVLRQALLGQARKWEKFEIADDTIAARGSTVVIATARDCSPQACRTLVDAGHQVVVLTPVWREHDHAEYTSAGAVDYLPMDFDLSQLSLAVTTAAARIRDLILL